MKKIINNFYKNYLFDLLLIFLPISLFFFFVTIPIINLSYDMWDGVIIEYAKLNKDYTGLKIFCLESNWLLFYPFSIIIIKVSDLLSLSFKNTNAIFLLILAFFLIRENCILAKKQFKLKKFSIFFSATLIATFPAWENLLTSVLTFQYFCLLLGLLSIRIIHITLNYKKLIGFAILIIAYSLQSLLFFLPVLSFIYDLSKKNFSSFVYPSIKTILVLLFAILFFLIFNYFHPPYGLYKNYNSININNFKDFFLLIYAILKFATYLLPVLSIFFLFYFCVIVNKKKLNTQINTSKEIYNLNRLIFLLVLFFSGAFPYAIVGKESLLWQVDGWSGRHAFLLSVPISLFSALCLQILYDKILTRSLKFIFVLGGALVFLVNFVILISGVAYNTNRQIFVSKLEGVLRENLAIIKPGIFQIIGDNMPGPVFASYETNFLMYKITGKADWWIRAATLLDEEFTVPDYLQQNSKYQKKFIYNFNSAHLSNHTIMNIKVENFKGILNFFKNYFKFTSKAKITIISVLQKK